MDALVEGPSLGLPADESASRFTDRPEGRRRRTLAELVEAVDFGLGLDLALPDGFDLSLLAPLVPKLEYLCISSAGTVIGWEVLDHARRLVQLIVRADMGGGSPSGALPQLTRVIGPSELIRLACAAPKLVEFQVDLASEPWPAGLGFDGPIEYLEIARAGRLAAPPPLAFPTALRTLRIYNARDLDLGALAPGVDLEWLQIFRTKVLHGAATIAGMSRLRELDLESVANIPDAEALSAVTARRVNLVHSDPTAAAALQR